MIYSSKFKDFKFHVSNTKHQCEEKWLLNDCSQKLKVSFICQTIGLQKTGYRLEAKCVRKCFEEIIEEHYLLV